MTFVFGEVSTFVSYGLDRFSVQGEILASSLHLLSRPQLHLIAFFHQPFDHAIWSHLYLRTATLSALYLLCKRHVAMLGAEQSRHCPTHRKPNRRISGPGARSKSSKRNVIIQLIRTSQSVLHCIASRISTLATTRGSTCACESIRQVPAHANCGELCCRCAAPGGGMLTHLHFAICLRVDGQFCERFWLYSFVAPLFRIHGHVIRSLSARQRLL